MDPRVFATELRSLLRHRMTKRWGLSCSKLDEGLEAAEDHALHIERHGPQSGVKRGSAITLAITVSRLCLDS